MSFFTKTKTHQKPQINRTAICDFDGGNCAYILNTEYKLVKTRSDGTEEVSEALTKFEDKGELKRVITFFLSESDAAAPIHSRKRFIEDVMEIINNKLAANKLSEMSIEEKYKIVIEGALSYIPSSLLLGYDGTEEEKLLLFFSTRLKEN